jgi:hypothetical protein
VRSARPYTNTTFTHHAQPHRGAPPEPAVCPGCGAVYAKRRWSHSPDARVRANSAAQPVAIRICRACRQRESGVPHGYVHIDGDFFPAHRADIEHLLHNEVERAREDNPLHQVLGWEDFGSGTLLITTSTEHLAQRLGHALEKAYDGTVHYGFSHRNKLAHVWWHR